MFNGAGVPLKCNDGGDGFTWIILILAGAPRTWLKLGDAGPLTQIKTVATLPQPLNSPVAQSIRVRCDFLAIPLDNFTSGDTADKARGNLKGRI